MHKLYSHKGIILSSTGMGEKNNIVTIFSSGLGIIKAKAISSRDAKAKLRGHIVPYTLGTYTFVRGKEGWRLIQADAEKNILSSLNNLNKKKMAGKALKLLSAVSGEGEDDELFNCVASALESLQSVDEYFLKTFEAVFISRILFTLGYLSFEDLPQKLKELNNFSEALLVEAKHHGKTLISRINAGLQESQLTKAVY